MKNILYIGAICGIFIGNSYTVEASQFQQPYGQQQFQRPIYYDRNAQPSYVHQDTGIRQPAFPPQSHFEHSQPQGSQFGRSVDQTPQQRPFGQPQPHYSQFGESPKQISQRPQFGQPHGSQFGGESDQPYQQSRSRRPQPQSPQLRERRQAVRYPKALPSSDDEGPGIAPMQRAEGNQLSQFANTFLEQMITEERRQCEQNIQKLINLSQNLPDYQKGDRLAQADQLRHQMEDGINKSREELNKTPLNPTSGDTRKSLFKSYMELGLVQKNCRNNVEAILLAPPPSETQLGTPRGRGIIEGTVARAQAQPMGGAGQTSPYQGQQFQQYQYPQQQTGFQPQTPIGGQESPLHQATPAKKKKKNIFKRVFSRKKKEATAPPEQPTYGGQYGTPTPSQPQYPQY